MNDTPGRAQSTDCALGRLLLEQGPYPRGWAGPGRETLSPARNLCLKVFIRSSGQFISRTLMTGQNADGQNADLFGGWCEGSLGGRREEPWPQRAVGEEGVGAGIRHLGWRGVALKRASQVSKGSRG